jgi:serine-type D-Ala-D-Ala carboxypeptidase (penicillin-binding protein 5/6)
MKHWGVWLLVAAVLYGQTSVYAATKRARHGKAARRTHTVVPTRYRVPDEPPGGPYHSALLIDPESGRVLFEKEATRLWPPASMVKMMVALVAIEAIRSGEARLDDPVRVSRLASRTGGSRVFLRANEVLAFDELLRAMMVASANDAAVALSEALAGSTDAMVDRMNRRARELGMKDTVYHSVNGLPPKRGAGEPDITSAIDLATLARKLLEYPEVFRYSGLRYASFRGGRTRLHNTNHLVGTMDGVDGLKTGYYRLAGFNLTATASRNGLRLIAVVLGCPTLRSRFDLARDLLEWGFANYSRMDLVRAGESLAVDLPVANGTAASLRPVAAEGASFLVRKNESRDLKIRFQLPALVTAPVAKNQPLGEIIVHDGEVVVDVIPAVAPYSVERNATRRPVLVSQ